MFGAYLLENHHRTHYYGHNKVFSSDSYLSYDISITSNGLLLIRLEGINKMTFFSILLCTCQKFTIVVTISVEQFFHHERHHLTHIYPICISIWVWQPPQWPSFRPSAKWSPCHPPLSSLQHRLWGQVQVYFAYQAVPSEKDPCFLFW